MVNAIEPNSTNPGESPLSAADMTMQPVNVKDAFKLPYSLTPYKMTADRTHSLFYKPYERKFSRGSRISGLEFDAMARDSALKGKAVPPRKKQDYISTFIAKQSDLAHTALPTFGKKFGRPSIFPKPKKTFE